MEQDRAQTQPIKRTGAFGWFLRLKTVVVVFSIVGLLASNIASVLHAGFHDFLFAAIYKAALVVGTEWAESVARQSKKVEIERRIREQTADLRNQTDAAKRDAVEAKAREKVSDGKRVTAEADLLKERANVQRVSHDLVNERASLNKVTGELAGVNGQIKTMRPVLDARLAKGVSRNLAAIPAESIPYVGVAVVLAYSGHRDR